MTADQIIALMPLLILAAAAIVVMLGLAVRRSHGFTLAVTVAGMLAAMVALGAEPAGGAQVTSLLVIDSFSAFFMKVIISASLLVALLAHGYWSARAVEREEFYILLLLATAGAAALTAAVHFASFFLALEILSASLYAMIAYDRERPRAVEAGIKYLVLAGASSAVLLFGVALVYAKAGTLEMAAASGKLAGGGLDPLSVAGVAMILVGVGFKLALVPFHLWAADVYEGASAPVAAYVATVSKGAIFALLVRLAAAMNIQADPQLQAALGTAAIVTMFGGNLLALMQRNLKRMLAYSSIAHMGYLLVAFLAGGEMALTAVAFYLVAYFITSLAAFGVMIVLSGSARDADALEDYVGLSKAHPVLAVILAAALLSLAGMPLTAGFVGKFYLLAAGVGSGLWVLVAALVINSTLSLFYYLRFVAAAYSRAGASAQAAPPSRGLPSLAGVALAVLMILLVWLGVYPSPMIQNIQAVMSAWR
ncbi:MAG: NADH-quinone oxidoreductase subunit N [Phycisphaerae bacterium]|jgi:NADH-quinone oxidoreductase subunit N